MSASALTKHLPWREEAAAGGGTDLVLNVFVTELELHDPLEGPEECFVKVKVRRLTPVREDLGQDVVDEGHSLLRHAALFVTGSLRKTREGRRPTGSQARRTWLLEAASFFEGRKGNSVYLHTFSGQMIPTLNCT